MSVSEVVRPFLTINAHELWLKDPKLVEQVQDWLASLHVNPADCAEFTIVLTTPPRARFVLYDRRDGKHYMVGDQPAAFMETRLLGGKPAWVDAWLAR